MLLTVRDVVRILGMSERDVVRMAENAEMCACKVHGQYRFNRDDVVEWAAARRMALPVSPDDGGSPLPGLEGSLIAGGVQCHVSGVNKREVLSNAIKGIGFPPSVDCDYLTQMLLAREELASTSIGDGIAIPHVRNPMILPLKKPMMVLCYLEKPLEYDALDGKPVSVLFLLFTTSTRGHLHLLSRLMFALRDESFRRLLSVRAGLDELVGELNRLERTFAGSAGAEGKPS